MTGLARSHFCMLTSKLLPAGEGEKKGQKIMQHTTGKMLFFTGGVLQYLLFKSTNLLLVGRFTLTCGQNKASGSPISSNCAKLS